MRAEDYLKIVTGSAVCALAGVALAVYALRREARERTLVYFGAFAGLYGLRLLISVRSLPITLVGGDRFLWSYVESAITYVILLPGLLFAETLLGRGAWSSIRRLWQFQILFGTVAIAGSFVTGDPNWAMAPNSVIVIVCGVVGAAHLVQPGIPRTADVKVIRGGTVAFFVFVLVENLRGLGVVPFGTNVEAAGFVLFVASLGYGVLHRVFKSERRLAAIERDLETARHIQTSILPREVPQVGGLAIAARYLPMAEVAGDFYDFIGVDKSHVGVLVADVSGHGVPAALIASMVKVAAAAQAAEAAAPDRVLTEMNRTLLGNLERQFVTAAYVYVDVEARSLSYSNAGHPPPLVWRGSERRLQALRLDGILMGRFSEASYGVAREPLRSGDRIILYTDGVTETTNAAGEFFGPNTFNDFIAKNASLSADRLSDALLDHLVLWSGRREGFEDDLTLVVVDVL